jgi:hypothetical protein
MIVSSTNRGSQRVENDLYETNPASTNTFLDHFTLKKGPILECCAGRGAIIREIRKRYQNEILQIEIRPEEREFLSQFGLVEIADFRYWYNAVTDDVMISEPIGTIITNPPFSIAREIIEHCFEIASPETDIIMYLRQGFFSSESRRDFWERHPLRQYYPLINRPSHIKAAKCSKYPKTKIYLLNEHTCDWTQNFRLDETPPKLCPRCGAKVKVTSNDSSDYAWFVWSDTRPTIIQPI